MKTLLLDVDGVIADFAKGYREAAMIVTGRELPEFTTDWSFGDWGLSKDETKATIELVKLPDFVYKLDPIPGAIEAVRVLLTLAEVYFVTSSWSAPTWAYDRKRWLVKHFGEELGGRVVITEHKHLVHGNVFVDDKPENARAWETYWGTRALLWGAPYKRHVDDLQRVTRARETYWGTRALLWDAPYNRHVDDLQRVTQWAQVIEAVS